MGRAAQGVPERHSVLGRNLGPIKSALARLKQDAAKLRESLPDEAEGFDRGYCLGRTHGIEAGVDAVEKALKDARRRIKVAKEEGTG